MTKILQKTYKAFIGGQQVLEGISQSRQFSQVDDLDKYIDKSNNSLNTFILQDYQVTFDIKTDTKKNLNRGTFTFFNLQDDIVDYVANNIKKNTVFLFEAGFETDDVLRSIMKGTVVDYKDSKVGVDRKTTIYVEDGKVAATECYANFSFVIGQTYADVVVRCSKAMGLSYSVSNFEVADTVLKAPVYIYGNVLDDLDLWLRGLDVPHHAFILNHVLYVFPVWKAPQTNVNSVISITPESGLKGSPAFVSQPVGISSDSSDDDKQPKFIQVTCSLNTGLQVGDNFYLESNTLAQKGIYHATSINYKGNLEDNDKWDSIIIAAFVESAIRAT